MILIRQAYIYRGYHINLFINTFCIQPETMQKFKDWQIFIYINSKQEGKKSQYNYELTLN